MEKAIIVKNVSKRYKLYSNSQERALDLLFPKKYGEEFYALAGVDFEAKNGEVIGFIGVNGSGKSTLSNIIAGIVPQTSGEIKTNGQVSLIAVAAGLKNDLSGRDNIELKLLMLGFNKDEIKELEEDIIEFSELGKFIDQPVKSYSSGMKSRLGFAISVNIDPEILIIDEALSVGDKAFAEKSLDKMKEFKEQGKTMIFVSHSIGQMKKFCDKILWLEFGMVKEYGPVNVVIPKYESFLKKWKIMNKVEREKYRNEALKVQQSILSGSKKEYEMDIDSFYTGLEKEVKYKERLVSLLGRVRNLDGQIYVNPLTLEEIVPLSKYSDNTFYIKKQAILNKEKFYLVSLKPSAEKAVIGWVRANKLLVHQNIFIDEDKRTLILKGTGIAYDMPWGNRNNIIYKNLKEFKNEKFEAVRTELVAKNIWYKGYLQNKLVWINYKHFIDS